LCPFPHHFGERVRRACEWAYGEWADVRVGDDRKGGSGKTCAERGNEWRYN